MLQRRALSRSYLRAGRFLGTPLPTTLSSFSCDSRFGFHELTTHVPRRSFHSSFGVQEVKKESKQESANDEQRKTADEQKKEEAKGKEANWQHIALGSIVSACITFAITETVKAIQRIPTTEDFRESTINIANPELIEKYVHRPAVEKELDDFAEGKLKEKYLIVYGSKGAGKSSVAQKTLSGKKGVALVKVRDMVDKDELAKMIAQAVMNTKDKISYDPDELHDTLKKIATEINNAENANKSKYPTIVFEVEGGGTDEEIRLIENVRSFSKEFINVANVIIVLSEAIAVTTFGYDDDREKYMHVGDMTREEAKELLEKRGKHLNDTDFSYLYENIGGRPSQLADFASGEDSVQDFVRAALHKAYIALDTFPPQHRQLLKLLKQNPEGVRFGAYPVVELPQFGKDMKKSNVVYYDIGQGVIKLQSRTVKLTLKDFDLNWFVSDAANGGMTRYERQHSFQQRHVSAYHSKSCSLDKYLKVILI